MWLCQKKNSADGYVNNLKTFSIHCCFLSVFPHHPSLHQPSSFHPQWSYGFYLIHLQGKQGFQFFCKTEDTKRKWMEQFEMAMYVSTAPVSKLHSILLFDHRITNVQSSIHTGQTSNPKEPLPTSTTSKCTRLKRTPTAEPVKSCWGEGSHTQPPLLAELQRQRSGLKRAMTHVTRLLVWPLLHELLRWLAVLTRVKSYCTDLNLPPCSAG